MNKVGKIKDWNKLVRKLYNTGEYFVKRPLISKDQTDYWIDGKSDPDGKTRNIILEKDRYISENQYIINYINNNMHSGKLLDIGCGPGYLLSKISDDFQKFGCDTSKKAVESANQYGDVRYATVENCGFEKNEFDIVVALHFIEHTDDPLGFIKEIKRIMKKNATLIIAAPDFDSGCARRFGNLYRMLHDPTHIRLFSNDSMHRFLRDHDFSILNVEYPFFETERFFNKENMLKMLDKNLSVSPPFYGNFMTFFCINSS